MTSPSTVYRGRSRQTTITEPRPWHPLEVIAPYLADPRGLHISHEELTYLARLIATDPGVTDRPLYLEAYAAAFNTNWPSTVLGVEGAIKLHAAAALRGNVQ